MIQCADYADCMYRYSISVLHAPKTITNNNNITYGSSQIPTHYIQNIVCRYAINVYN